MKPVPKRTKILACILVFLMAMAVSAAATRVWLDALEPPAPPMAGIGREEPKAGRSDRIRVETPKPGETVSSPLRVAGEARGWWFFEADFPVLLLDADGHTVVSHYAMTAADWMTEDFVPFESVLVFDPPATGTGVLVLARHNASGLPEHDDEIRIPVRFAPPGESPAPEPAAPASGECRRAGCSGQVCADRDVVTTCEFRPEYACYQNARCERQPSGECGWTPTLELRSCLQDAAIGGLPL